MPRSCTHFACSIRFPLEVCLFALQRLSFCGSPPAFVFLQVKSVCSNLRSCGVRGHLGVFGVHYEADNSRLYVVCAKHVTESQLQDEFTVFGSAHVKLNLDTNSLSKVIIHILHFNLSLLRLFKKLLIYTSTTPWLITCDHQTLPPYQGKAWLFLPFPSPKKDA